MSNAHLGDEVEQQRDIGPSVAANGARVPFAPQLHGMFEAQLPRRLSAVCSGRPHDSGDNYLDARRGQPSW